MNRTHSSPPTSPTSPVRRKQAIPPGFRPFARPTPPQRPIAQLTVRELQDRHRLNANKLSSPGASSSTHIERIAAEQTAIESRLVDLEGVETINTGLKGTRITDESDMSVDVPPEPPATRMLDAKRRALAQYGVYNQGIKTATMSLQEAMDLERQAHFQDQERKRRIEEKKKRLGLPIKGEILTKEEREARIWAFMNHKPTDSDLEDDDDDDDSDDDDPATWFEDDQYEEEDFSDMIQIDDSRVRYSTFYENRRD